MNDNWLQKEEQRLRAEEAGYALALGRDPKLSFADFAIPRKPAAFSIPTPMPPPTGTEQFIRSVEQACPECYGSGRDSASVDLLAFDAPDCPECAGSGRAIVTRNYLTEALMIAANPDSTRPMEREHLVAIVQYARQMVSAAVMLPDVKLPEVA